MGGGTSDPAFDTPWPAARLPARQKRLPGKVLHLALPGDAPLLQPPAQFFEEPRAALRLYNARESTI
jgi:hypothetical protein